MSIYKGTTLIAGSLPNAANQDLSNLSQTGQAVIDGKADVDLTNVTDTGYIKMAGASMPSNKYIDLTLGASPSTYTAPANGWFCINMSTSAAAQYINMINNTSGFAVEGGNAAKGNWIRLSLPVLKNDVVAVGYNASEVKLFRFYYAKGSESEAS